MSTPDSPSTFLINSTRTDSNDVARLATINSTDEGKSLSKAVWQETMDELAFAGVENIIASMN